MEAAISIIGNGSFATALAKVLSDKGHTICWWMRSEEAKEHLMLHHHNPHYLSQVVFPANNIFYTNDMQVALDASAIILLAVPSAYLGGVLALMDKHIAKEKIFVSAIKGIMPPDNILINEYLEKIFELPEDKYCCITGPCHAEEIAAEKLSYLTFSSHSEKLAHSIATFFETFYLRTVISTDVYGVQFAAILKNIYALGAGIANGLDYGDNFLSVYNTNCFAEMKSFMKTIAEHKQQLNTPHHYITSAYLGDLLVTSYSLHSRNRRFGKMIGKGYSVEAAKMELNMVAEGYFAAKCIKEIALDIHADCPIVMELYNILWHAASAKKGFKNIETLLQ
jgi:glycerol-3-phosphate dehydrogenase (NAD(P)+)